MTTSSKKLLALAKQKAADRKAQTNLELRFAKGFLRNFDADAAFEEIRKSSAPKKID